MSETTMSDWPQFYDHQGLSNQEIGNRVRVLTSGSVFGADHQGSDSNAVVNNPTTVPLSSGLAGATGGGSSGGGGGGHFSVEGRVGKPVRRRSRASRRTPTTLLNTDTTNFRAMVQQFTGGPSAPFSATGGSPNFGLAGFGTRQPQLNPNNSLIFPPPAGFHLQYHQHQQQQQQQNSLIQHPNQPLMFSLNGNNNNPGNGTGEVLFQRLGGGVNMEGGGGGGGGGASRTSESPNENRSNNPSRLMF